MHRAIALLLAAALARPAPVAAAADGALRGDPVDTSTGRFLRHDDDFILPGTPPIAFWRTYHSGDDWGGPLGIGTTHAYELRLVASGEGVSGVQLILPDAARVDYVRVSGSTHLDSVFQHHGTPTIYDGSRLLWNGNGWDIRFRDGAVYAFTACGGYPGSQCLLVSQRDAQGRILRIDRHGGRLLRVAAPDGRRIDFSHDAAGRIAEARDHRGQVVRYQYDAAGRLVRAERTLPGFFGCAREAVRRRFAGTSRANGPDGGVTGCAFLLLQRTIAAWVRRDWGGVEVQEFGYDTRHRIVSVREPPGAPRAASFTNVYDDRDRVVAQLLGDGTRYELAYTVDDRGRITGVDMTERDGRRRHIAFDSTGYVSAETFALGTPYEVRVDYERRSGSQGWGVLPHCPAALGGGELRGTAGSGDDIDRVAEALVRRCWKLDSADTRASGPSPPGSP